jgi:hypothetical protein
LSTGVFSYLGEFVSRYIRLSSLVVFFISTFALSAPALAGDSAAQPKAVASKFVPPKLIQMSYEVTKNGQPFAKVKEQFAVTGNTYKIESITKGIGVYALFGERRLTSAGELTAEGLKPSHFELHQGDNPKKSLLADFDWSKQTLRMMVKGKPKDAALMPGAQDLASYAYQFMFMPAPLKESVSVALTTGKKLNHYQYKINPEHVSIDSAGKQYKALHLVQSTQDKAQTETKELWLGVEHYYLPVRIMLIDENGAKIEQTLTELLVD